MRMGAIVVDSNNPEELSDFYKHLLGWKKKTQYFEDEKWIIVKSDDSTSLPLVFQEVLEYERPTWPAKKGVPQQMLHIDFYTSADEYEDEISRAISLGAVASNIQLSDSWKVMLDPAGHPFCIIPLQDEL